MGARSSFCGTKVFVPAAPPQGHILFLQRLLRASSLSSSVLGDRDAPLPGYNPDLLSGHGMGAYSFGPLPEPACSVPYLIQKGPSVRGPGKLGAVPWPQPIFSNAAPPTLRVGTLYHGSLPFLPAFPALLQKKQSPRYVRAKWKNSLWGVR